MKRYLLLAAAIFCFNTSQAQVIEFFDDFESGPVNWTLTGSWFTTGISSYSGVASLTDSPFGNYADVSSTSATLNTSIDLLTALGADVTFWATYDIEFAFDTMYLEASQDGGGSWIPIEHFTGEGFTTWTEYTISLGGFVGNSDVRLRFRFETDDLVNFDGMFIDDFTVTSSNLDAAGPLIYHIPSVNYESQLGDQTIVAEIFDISNVSSADIYYTVDGGSAMTSAGTPTFGDNYTFTIPAQAPGSWVDYWIEAFDDTPSMNPGTSDTFQYIAGNHIFYDDNSTDFVTSFGPGSTVSTNDGVAVKITLDGTTDVVTALIKHYTDIGRPNDSVDIHIWSDVAGLPGADMVPPIRMFPEANLGNPNTMTRVDLRPFSGALSGMSGDFFIGFTVPTGETWTAYTNIGTALRTYTLAGATWTNVANDYHFRVVTSDVAGMPDASFTYDAALDPMVAFTDASTNTPTDWLWEFEDGGATSTLQNPDFTFALNGTFNVCLTASNAFGSSTYCDLITISNNAIAPVTSFSFDDSADPTVDFTDLSTNTPTDWMWLFGDGATSTDQNPTHTYSANDSYVVCLEASNSGGASSSCQTVVISNVVAAPIADFSWAITGSTGDEIQFTDLSSGVPTGWSWDFDDAGATSSDQDPLHTYSADGTYNVCLEATNSAGTSPQVCQDVSVAIISGLYDVLNDIMHVGPIPVSDLLVVQFEGLLSETNLIISDAAGKVVFSTETFGNESLHIPVRHFAAGYYLLKASNEDGMTIRKILVNR